MSLSERVQHWLEIVKWYYARFKIIIHIVAPILILIWYVRNRHKIKDSHTYWDDLSKRSLFFFSVPFDLTQETFIVRVA
jgi:hypothetical protein